MNHIARIVDGEQHTAIFNETGETFTFTEDHVNFDELMDAISAQDREVFKHAYSIAEALEESFELTDADIKIVSGEVVLDGEVVHNDVCDKIIEFYRSGIDYDYLINFLVRLQKNPSKNSVDQLFRFLQHKNLAIGPDGRFWAYKSVRSDYFDKFSGKFDNSVGKICEVPRNKVDDNPNNHCSHGFHCGSFEYAGPGGWYNSGSDRVMIVAVDPADVVSVPNDHNFQKLRTCKYEVLTEYSRPLETVEHSVAIIGGVENDPEELEMDDNVVLSIRGEDYTGRVHDVYPGGLDLLGQDSEGYVDIFTFDFDEIDNVRYT